MRLKEEIAKQSASYVEEKRVLLRRQFTVSEVDENNHNITRITLPSSLYSPDLASNVFNLKKLLAGKWFRSIKVRHRNMLYFAKSLMLLSFGQKFIRFLHRNKLRYEH